MNNIVPEEFEENSSIYIIGGDDSKNHENRINSLKEKYKEKLVECSKSIDEIIKYIKSKYNLIKVCEGSEKYCELTRLTLQNIKHTTDTDDIDLEVYEVVHDDKSKSCYIEFRKGDNEYSIETPIYIYIERNKGYIECNHSPIFIDLTIYKGITKFDIDYETTDFLVYLNFLDEINN